MAEGIFPENIMLHILTRLPVRSLCRFKIVHKSWCSLFSSSSFIADHRVVSASNPENRSLFIQTSEIHRNQFFFLKVNSQILQVLKVFHELPRKTCFDMGMIGSLNGMVGLACLNFSAIILWNPAIRRWKSVRLLENPPPFSQLSISFGMAFDSSTDDFKLLSIIHTSGKAERARLYSTDRGRWEEVQIEFAVSGLISPTNLAILFGVPYWGAIVNHSAAFLRYDVKNGVFDHIPKPQIPKSRITLVEWGNRPAALVHTTERMKEVSLMLFDEPLREWITQLTIDTGVGISRQIECIPGGQILLQTLLSKFFLLDPKTRSMKEVNAMAALRAQNFSAFNYTETLVRVMDMKPVKAVEGSFHFDFEASSTMH